MSSETEPEAVCWARSMSRKQGSLRGNSEDGGDAGAETRVTCRGKPGVEDNPGAGRKGGTLRDVLGESNNPGTDRRGTLSDGPWGGDDPGASRRGSNRKGPGKLAESKGSEMPGDRWQRLAPLPAWVVVSLAKEKIGEMKFNFKRRLN